MRELTLTRFIVGFINLVFSIVLVGLILRLIFRLFGANPNSNFTEFLYASTSPLLDPFRGIFRPYIIEQGNVLEISTLIAIIIYLIVAWLLVEFVYFVSHRSRSYREV